MIKKVLVRNYRMLREFELELSPGMNMLVGANDTGKSTLIEAVNLALTGRIDGRSFQNQLSPYLLNLQATREWVDTLKPKAGTAPGSPPSVIIELYFDDTDEATQILRGTNNLLGEDACGVRIQAILSTDFDDEYRAFIKDPENIQLVPTEYYKVEWLGFSGSSVTYRSIPATCSVIDSSAMRLQSGADYHLQQIISTHLEPNERAELSRQYRSLREDFSGKDAVKVINTRLSTSTEHLSDKDFSLAIDISQRYTWESSLLAHLDNLPFQFIGKGEQSSLKILLALGREVKKIQVVLIEEPEIHLAFTKLRRLLPRIEHKCVDKQMIVATHSSYVLNKLGLEHLILLADQKAVRLTDLPKDTAEYFKKLPGYDTLRLVLAEKVILVEGPSDELIIQRAYLDQHKHLPIDDGIDVISVGTSHKRFLDLALKLNRKVNVVTDNDGKTMAEMKAKFADYIDAENVKLCTGSDPGIKTLEPQIVAVNDLDTLNTVLGGGHKTKPAAEQWMSTNKTVSALAILESKAPIEMPEYIKDAISI